MALRFLSGSNGFIPEATGQVIAFIRRQDEFPLNQYVQYVPTPKDVGLYMQLGRDEMIRVVSDAEFAWEDGDDRPAGEYNKVPFQYVEFRTFRRDYPWRVGYKAINQAEKWAPKVVHMDAAISKAMTNRTNRVIKLIENTANWGANAATASALNGGAGLWTTASDDPTSANFEAIYKSLVQAFRQINLQTNGKVKQKDLVLVVSPNLAIAMSQAPEIINYVRQTPQALQILEKGLNGNEQFDTWGLPPTYRGFKIVVENTPIVNVRANTGNQATQNTNATPTDSVMQQESSTGNPGRAFAKTDSIANLLSRPGGLDGEYGAPSFSTVQLYHYQELLRVQAFNDPKNERVEGHVTEDIMEVMPCNLAGFCITGCM